MPKGPFGLSRLTDLGPFVENTYTDLTPRFKTKSFTWDSVEFQYESTGGLMSLKDTIENPGGRGVESGSSLSLDGAYNDRRHLVRESTLDYITFIYNIDVDNDIPFFYLNPYGKRDATIDGRKIVFDSPTYFSEAEVVIRNAIRPSEAKYVVNTVSVTDVDRLSEERKNDIRNNEDAERFGWKDSAIDRTDMRAGWAKENIQKINNEYNVIDEVPRTDFRNKVRDLSDGITDYDYVAQWGEIEKRLRPIHTAIAETYNIEYNMVVDKANKIISSNQ